MLSRVHIAGYGLVIGAIGQGILYRSVFPLFLSRMIPFIVFPPWLIIYTPFLCRVPRFGPKRCCRHLILAMCWYASTTLVVEALLLLFLPAPGKDVPLELARTLACGAALTFIVFVYACIQMRRYESKLSH